MYFRTGIEGDFEFLVRLLKPRELDARVGRRDIDVQRPGSNLDGIVGPKADGVLRLGGALRIPEIALTPDEKAEAQQFENWAEPRPHQFQSDLASFINLSDDYAELSATDAHEQPTVPADIGALPGGDTDPDPLITPPLYGTWHALTRRLLSQRNGTPVPNTNNWVHQLNLDPRHRVAAGFGTKVVRERQEDYMNAAWEQIGDVLKANNKLRLAQLGMAVSLSWYQRHLLTVSEAAPAKFLSLSAPMMKRVVLDGFTINKRVADSRVPLSVTGVAMRRALRPNGRLIRSLPEATANEVRNGSIIDGLNENDLTVAQPPAIPSGAATVPGLSQGLVSNLPEWLIDLLRKYRSLPLWFLIILLILALILLLLFPILAVAIAVVAVVGFFWLRQKAAEVAASDAMLPANEDPAVIATLPADAAFVLEPFGVVGATARPGGSDSADAVQFKQALGQLFELRRDVAVANTPIVRGELNLAAIATTTVTTIDPARSIPLRFYRIVHIPDRIKGELRETFVEAMAYPRIDEPMYRPLADIGAELLLPNIGLIPPDSLTLLETNQRFIESYMVGLNHEFARELLWREYPTDQRGSYFRQFWDVSGYQNVEGLSADALREKLYDIPKLHLWPAASELGAHDNRQPPGSPPKDELVLSIRGELLKRYPTAVIYAHQAAWQRRADGTIDKSLIRIPVPLTPAEEDNPPRDKVKTPLYQAKVDPDITFFGFDLTSREAKGDPATDDAGWFFIIKERPGEPRFGLDIERGSAPLNSWSDLAWNDVTVQNGLLRINATMNEHELTVAPPSSEGPEEMAQHLEDKQLKWDRNTNAADVAYVLYQLPVLVAVHAAEMLPD